VEGGELEAGTDGYLRSLAALPVSFLSEQGERLAGLCKQVDSSAGYCDLFASSVWVYSMHVYMTMVREKMGHKVADTVWSHQRCMLDEAQAGAGDSMDLAFMLIDRALDPGDLQLDVPGAAGYRLPEARVALALLLGMPESPDCTARTGVHPVRLKPVNTEVEERLAHCLLRARVEILAACATLFKRDTKSH